VLETTLFQAFFSQRKVSVLALMTIKIWNYFYLLKNHLIFYVKWKFVFIPKPAQVSWFFNLYILFAKSS